MRLSPILDEELEGDEGKGEVARVKDGEAADVQPIVVHDKAKLFQDHFRAHLNINAGRRVDDENARHLIDDERLKGIVEEGQILDPRQDRRDIVCALSLVSHTPVNTLQGTRTLVDEEAREQQREEHGQ